MTRRHLSPFAIEFVAAAAIMLSVPAARSGLPHALAVADDVADRIMLFNPQTGAYIGVLVPGDPEHLSAPFDCASGPQLEHGGNTYPDTILVSDLRQQAVVAFDATNGTFIKTLIGSVTVRGLAFSPDGRLLVAAGAAGVRMYQPNGTFVQTLVPYEPVDGPKNAWDVLVRPSANEGVYDVLVADPTLDTIFQFDLEGNRLEVFARLPAFNFIEQLALRINGHVLAVDVFGNAVHEFQADGTLVRTIVVTRPRGVIELYNRNLLIASEDGVQVFDGQNGELLSTSIAGYPTSAPRYVAYLRCRMPAVLGDMNGDGVVNSFDVDPFVLALADPEEFALRYPAVDRVCAGDANLDGTLNTFDIDPFIDILLG